MVKKILLTISIALTLSACTTPQIKTVYQDKDIPIPYVPHPPVVARPMLDIQTLTPAQKADQGELTKSLNISLHQMKDYACTLETIVNQYRDLANMPLTSLLTIPATTPTMLSTVWTKMVTSLSTAQPTPLLPVLPAGSCTP